jgi:hypothetical protein
MAQIDTVLGCKPDFFLQVFIRLLRSLMLENYGMQFPGAQVSGLRLRHFTVRDGLGAMIVAHQWGRGLA